VKSQLATPPTERDSVGVAVAEQAPNRGHSVPLVFGAELWISWFRPKRAGQPRQAGWHTLIEVYHGTTYSEVMRFRIESPRPGRQVHVLCGAVASCLPLQGCAYSMRLNYVDTYHALNAPTPYPEDRNIWHFPQKWTHRRSGSIVSTSCCRRSSCMWSQ